MNEFEFENKHAPFAITYTHDEQLESSLKKHDVPFQTVSENAAKVISGTIAELTEIQRLLNHYGETAYREITTGTLADVLFDVELNKLGCISCIGCLEKAIFLCEDYLNGLKRMKEALAPFECKAV